MKKIYIYVAALILAACGRDPVIGTWLQSAPDQLEKQQGFTLHEDGRAESVNMEKLSYTNWFRKGDILTLTGECGEEGQKINISTEFYIQKLNPDLLELKLQNTVLAYLRKTE